MPRRECFLERAIAHVRRELFGSPACSSDTIQIRSYQDSEEPRTASVLVSKLAEMLEGAQNGILQEVLCVSDTAAHQPEGGAVQRIEMLADKLLKRSRGYWMRTLRDESSFPVFESL